jgi:hypothetical protein
MPYWEIQNLMIISAAILAALIPITGLTLRFAIKPFLADIRSTKKESVPVETGQQLSRIEERLDDLEVAVRRLAEAADFDRQLRSGTERPRVTGTGPATD